MRKSVYVLPALWVVIATGAWAQIDFSRKSWADVLADAKQQRKLIFVDVYTTWCGPCKMFDSQVFSSRTVGKQFNSHFINYKADAERGGLTIARTYNVSAYPTGLFINGDGQLVHSFVGFRPVEVFQEEGKQAFRKTPDGMKMLLYTNAYESGERSGLLVRELLQLHRRYGQEYTPLADDYLKSLPTDSLSLPLNRLIAYENIDGIGNRAFEVVLDNRHDERFRTRGRIAVSQTLTRLIETKDEQGLPALMAAVDRLEGEQAETAKGDYRLQFYRGVKRWTKYAEEAERFVTAYVAPKLTEQLRQQQPDEFQVVYYQLCDIAWHVARETNSQKLIQTLANYVQQANQLTETYQATGACACLLYQLGQKEQALTLQEKAVLLAEKAGTDTQLYRDTLKRMQKGKSL